MDKTKFRCCSETFIPSLFFLCIDFATIPGTTLQLMFSLKHSLHCKKFLFIKCKGALLKTKLDTKKNKHLYLNLWKCIYINIFLFLKKARLRYFYTTLSLHIQEMEEGGRGEEGMRGEGGTLPLLTSPLSTVGWLQKPQKI